MTYLFLLLLIAIGSLFGIALGKSCHRGDNRYRRAIDEIEINKIQNGRMARAALKRDSHE